MTPSERIIQNTYKSLKTQRMTSENPYIGIPQGLTRKQEREICMILDKRVFDWEELKNAYRKFNLQS